MKEGLRQCAAWLHTWTGLVVGWVLFFVFATGTAGYFQQEITRWMQPERPLVTPYAVDDLAALADRALDRLAQVAPAAASWRITLPHEGLAVRGWHGLSIEWEEMRQAGHQESASGSERLDPVTGTALPADPVPRATQGGFGLYRMHYELHYMPYNWAVLIVGACTMLMLLAIVSGVITHKKIFKDFFTFRPGKGQRSWLDAHNAVSVMALPFFLMITYSGLVFFMFTYLPAGLWPHYGAGAGNEAAFYGELYPEDAHEHGAVTRPAVALAPLIAQAESAWGKGQVTAIGIDHHKGKMPVVTVTGPQGRSLAFWNPPTLRFHALTGEPVPAEPVKGGGVVKTHEVMINLHEGLFAGTWGRWLYFIAGLLGCAMIGTGLVLWSVKRRRHHLGSGLGSLEPFGVRLVEVLNVATLAGLPLAMAAYFWANRLLPVVMADRAAWEFHSLFAVWLAALFYALARPPHRAWIELLWAACGAYALVPVLNTLTTDKHLLNTLPHALTSGDWVWAGVDLTMWGLAALLAVMAVKVTRRLRPVEEALSPPAAIEPGLHRGAA